MPDGDGGGAPKSMKAWRWRSVRLRITLVATALVGVTLALGAWGLVSLVERQLTDRACEDATRALDTTVGAFQRGEQIGVVGVAPIGGPWVQVIDAEGNLVQSAPGTPVMQLFALNPEGELVPVSGFLANRYEIVQRIVNAQGGNFRVIAASPLDEVRTSVQALASNLWLGIPLLVVLVGVVTWWLVGRALHPVERMRQEVEEISHTTLHRRVEEPATGDEVARLAHTMNDMLDRLEAAQTTQRRFVSDASHELRSPLATIRTSVEVAKLHPHGADWPDVATTVLHESERLDELVADLLALAKLDETGNGDAPRARGTVDLDEVVLADVARQQALGHVVRAEGVSAARVEGDAVQLQRLVRNLLDNAARHATAVVTVTLGEEGGEAVLRVDDDGPGIPPADRERVFERFARLDEGRARAIGGAGLGLSLVKAVTVSHGGSVAVLDAPVRGARFEVRLPLVEIGEPASL